MSVGIHAAAILLLLAMYRGFVIGAPAPPQSDVVAIALPSAGAPTRIAPPPPAATPRVDRRYEIIVPPPTVIAPPPASRLPPPAAGGGADSGQRATAPGGTGALALGPARGDTRVWVGPMYIPEGGGRPIDMDSIVRRRLLTMAALSDSLMRLDSLNPNRNPYEVPRWIVERNGKKYGIDANAIHLGSFSIPTALLALLNVPQGNIDQARANQRLAEMRADILRAAARAEAEDDFRRAVSQIRERKDRERRERRIREEAERQRNRDNDRPLP